MLSFPGSLRIFLAVEPCDMRKSFNGLYAVVTEHLKENPLDGGLYVFTNKRRNRLKILFWDGTGLWGTGQASGERNFQLAPRPRSKRRQTDHQARGLGDADGRHRLEARACRKPGTKGRKSLRFLMSLLINYKSCLRLKPSLPRTKSSRPGCRNGKAASPSWKRRLLGCADRYLPAARSEKIDPGSTRVDAQGTAGARTGRPGYSRKGNDQLRAQAKPNGKRKSREEKLREPSRPRREDH